VEKPCFGNRVIWYITTNYCKDKYSFLYFLDWLNCAFIKSQVMQHKTEKKTMMKREAAEERDCRIFEGTRPEGTEVKPWKTYHHSAMRLIVSFVATYTCAWKGNLYTFVCTSHLIHCIYVYCS
jgi:hypothetical protein